MQLIHIILIILKCSVILGILLVRLKIIPNDLPLIHIIDETFKLILAIFVMFISYPGRKKIYPLNHEDLLFLFACGFILMLTIDYKEYLLAFKNLWNNITKYMIH